MQLEDQGLCGLLMPLNLTELLGACRPMGLCPEHHLRVHIHGDFLLPPHWDCAASHRLPQQCFGEKEPVLQSYICTMPGVLGSWESPQHHGHESNGKMRLGVSDAERGVVCLSQTGFV